MKCALQMARWTAADVHIVCGATAGEIADVFAPSCPERVDLTPALGHAFAGAATLELACLVDAGAGRVLAVSAGLFGQATAVAVETVDGRSA
jgi:hypothetical protein